ncbi:MAG: CHAT domain-containing protein [Myxococcales bacterium]|nr:CHAT domain-containing protein [Myxococcales bacterium]
MDRPSLLVLTVGFTQAGRALAADLGKALYDRICRPLDEPLASGPGVSVRIDVDPESVDPHAADMTVIVAVLDRQPFLWRGRRSNQVVSTLEGWHSPPSTYVLPLVTHASWSRLEDRLPAAPLTTELEDRDDGTSTREHTLDEIVLALIRALSPRQQEGSRLFLSFSGADAEAQQAAEDVHEYVSRKTTAPEPYLDDADKVLPGARPRRDRIGNVLASSVFVAFVGDRYSDATECVQELLVAKAHGVPTLLVYALQDGQRHASAYLGNAPSLVWRDDPRVVASRAALEWLRAEVFRREAARIRNATAHSESSVHVLVRPPEVLDLAQGPLTPSPGGTLVIHPDPEQRAADREVLRGMSPRLRLVTPTTAYRRRLANNDGTADVAAPLDGAQVALSLSGGAELELPSGLLIQHVEDATVYLARCLVSAGAPIAYGGIFKLDKGYTELLVRLIADYNQTASDDCDLLHSYLAAHHDPAEANGVDVQLHHLAAPDSGALLPPPEGTPSPARMALHYSDMRRVMAERCFARVILGGAVTPKRADDDRAGYRGRFPGVVEEAWRTLQVKRPLYVVGGFGGASGLVAHILCEQTPPSALMDGTWSRHRFFRKRAAAIDAEPDRELLGLPSSMVELAEQIHRLGQGLLGPDAEAMNGLTAAQNRQLMETTDPLTIAKLVMRGLVRVHQAQQAATGALSVELVQGDVTHAPKLDVLSIGTFSNVPMAGAGEQINRKLLGLASASRSGDGTQVVPVGDADLDADWLFMADMGQLDPTALPAAAGQAARATAEMALRHGFRRIGVVTFGGSLADDLTTQVRAMVSHLRSLSQKTTIVWCEQDPGRYEVLRKALTSEVDVQLSTLDLAKVVPSSPPTAGPLGGLMLHVTRGPSHLNVTVAPPADLGAPLLHQVPMTDAEIVALSEGGGVEQRTTPPSEWVARRGQELADRLFAGNLQLMGLLGKRPIEVVHDEQASKLPFEMLCTQPPDKTTPPPAIRGGLSRRLAVRNTSIDQLLLPPARRGKLRILLVANPTPVLAPLPAADLEANAVARILEGLDQRIELEILRHGEATVQAVQEALRRSDVLHYCGHAFYDGPTPDESGLVLAGKARLTLSNLERGGAMPRLVFANACESARVRGVDEARGASAFAEFFLRGRVEAYIGTLWRVADRAAAEFASDAYHSLAAGNSLQEAVRTARRRLLESDRSDWANYVLYGNPHMTLTHT